MPALLNDIDPNGLLEYSVVYTDRALNHMSGEFQHVMRDISGVLKTAYNAPTAVIVPGSGTYGMESVARQFANDANCLVLRHGWFSYRWSQILEAGKISRNTEVLLSRREGNRAPNQPFAPAPVDEAVAQIKQQKPDVVFAPHVETSAGLILPDDHITALASATHEVGGLFVLDCIASGTIWVDMEKTGVDVLISAPQKGWSGPPCCGLVMLSSRARAAIDNTESSSYSMDLKKWLQIMEAYESGGHAYHATMPTVSLQLFRNVMQETVEFGLDNARAMQQELGDKARALLESQGFESVAAAGFKAPGVIVSYTNDPAIQNGQKFKEVGLQVAAGVPLMVDEGDEFSTFRIGLFGLDKLKNVDRTVASLEQALQQIYSPSQ